MKRTIWIALLLAGCRAPIREEAPPIDHPAHPDAPAAPVRDNPVLDRPGQAARETTAPEAPAAPALYACPMHPEVISSEPGRRCPKCGMELEAIRAGDER